MFSPINLKREAFIKRSIDRHGAKYSYELLPEDFSSLREKIKITCIVHGVFTTKAEAHITASLRSPLMGSCMKCEKEKKLLEIKQFVNSLEGYTFVSYSGWDTLLIEDSKGVYNIKYAALRRGERPTRAACLDRTKHFIACAKEIHGDSFDYSSTAYGKNAKSKIKITCKQHGEVFEQTPDNHMQASGCSVCIQSRRSANRPLAHGFSNSSLKRAMTTKDCKSAILYVIRLYNENESFIKIGYTSQSIHDRYRYEKFPYQYEVMEEIVCTVEKVLVLERELHAFYKSYKYSPKFKFSGSSECFSMKVLEI